MKNENENNMLDRSRGTQLKSKENGISLHSVKEVCTITGLTRKQLFDYQKMVPPTAYDKSDYKLYDDEAIQRLMIIAELRSIDIPLAQIRNVLEEKSEKKSVILAQIDALEKQKKIVDEMIAKAKDIVNSN